MDEPKYGKDVQIGRYRFHFSSLHLLFWLIGLAFLGEVLLGSGFAAQGRGGLLGLGSIDGDTVWAAGSSGANSFREPDQWWRSFTSIFLHVSVMHLLMNLWCLHSLGRMVDQIYGPTRLLLAFLVTGLGGNLAVVIWDALTADPALPSGSGVGASGAVCGLLGLVLAHMRSRSDAIANLYGRQLLQWSLMILVFGLLVPQVSNTAHVGGFVTGYLLAQVLQVGHFDSLNKSLEQRVVLALTIALTIATLAACVVSGIGAPERRSDIADAQLIWDELRVAHNGLIKGQTRPVAIARRAIKETAPTDPALQAVRRSALKTLTSIQEGEAWDLSDLSELKAEMHALEAIERDWRPDNNPRRP